MRVQILASTMAAFLAGCATSSLPVRASHERVLIEREKTATVLVSQIKSLSLPEVAMPRQAAQRLLLVRDQQSVNPYLKNGPTKWRAYCNSHAPDCEVRVNGMTTPLTQTVWRALQKVNQHINARIHYRPDPKNGQGVDKWVRPVVTGNGFVAGDCEDYVLAKRHALMQRGFPAGALRFTLVARNGSPTADHAVLVVATDKGDFVLDNTVDTVRPVEATSYRYVSMHLASVADPHRFRHTLPRPQPIMEARVQNVRLGEWLEASAR